AAGPGAEKPHPRIVTMNVEHSSILKTCEYLMAQGSEVDILPVNASGLIDLDQLEAAVTSETNLVSLQWVNNETGVVQPVEQVSAICQRKGVPFHTDAAQAVGKIPVDLVQLPVDYLTLTAHKFHGPQGVGACFVRSRNKLQPFYFGGDQEYSLRAGTENVPGIVGMGKAAELRQRRFATVVEHVSELRNEFEKRICDLLPDVRINGQAASRVGNTSNLLFVGIDGQALVAHLDQDGIRCSQSSACTNQRPEPSYVLRAMGLSEEEAFASVRFGFSEENTEEEIDFVVERVVNHCIRLRQFRRQLFTTGQLTGEIS
ncbi:MAG: cysteine desulfurase, partial [Planctomycetes bacterium]|nr:cysteine desulfurase [Planctomycetota bacterium]